MPPGAHGHDVVKLDEGIGPHLAELVAFRRDLHAHPELKYEEHRTAERVAGALEALGLPVSPATRVWSDMVDGYRGRWW